MNKEKSIMKIDNENYVIKGTPYKCENGETTVRIKVYNERNPKKWMVMELENNLDWKIVSQSNV